MSGIKKIHARKPILNGGNDSPNNKPLRIEITKFFLLITIDFKPGFSSASNPTP